MNISTANLMLGVARWWTSDPAQGRGQGCVVNKKFLWSLCAKEVRFRFGPDEQAKLIA